MEIAVLRHDEVVRLDPERVMSLYAELGEREAEHVVERAMQEMALRLGAMERDWRRRDLAGLGRDARTVARLSHQVGMATMGRVAADVAAAAAAMDVTACAATFARLRRIGDRSLAAVWDIRDMSG
ncbi:MAG: hypothetical protein KJZ85_09555 [Rhodobacteraceae bacterium]|nr:hypothetical protein [Paracoccaceae bacterium]